MIKEKIKNLIKKTIKAEFGEIKMPEIEVEKPENKEFGDYSSNVAMQLARVLKKEPREIVRKLELGIRNQESGIFGKIEVADPGFINFYLDKEYLQKQIGEILGRDEKFGSLDIGKKKKVHPVKSPVKLSATGFNRGIPPKAELFNRVNVEFISANPTGPLTLGNGRGGFCGDVLANVLEKAGYKVAREYYINDVGEQILKLGHSVIRDDEAVYKGEYIDKLRERIEEKEPKETGEMSAKIILEEMIKPAVKKMKINFDVWFSEKSLYESKEVDKVLAFLKKKKLVYEKDGALWFKSTQFSDDKDRVLVKADGEKTYLASDVAYLENKFGRGFDKLIYIWGADHYGYIGRVKAACQALGYEPEKIAFIIMQLVRLTEAGKEVRMSKRAGIFVTLEELIDEVGLDVARFFFLMRSSDTHLNFDMSLAKEQSEKNPVFYIQYAYARISSILRKLKAQSEKRKATVQSLKLLIHPNEIELIKQLIRFPEIVEDIVKDYQVQRLPNYVLELVTAFHKFYEDCRVISDDKDLTQARLGLVLATKIVLKNTLDLMGISAPEKM